MKKFKLYKIKKNMKLYTLGIAITISLTSCGKKQNVYSYDRTETTAQTTTTEMTTTEQVTEYIEPSDSEIITSEYIEPTTESKDDIVLNYFDEQYNDFNNSMGNDLETYKSKGKSLIITFIDFLFYDGEIYGITYDELSEGVKEQIYEDFCNIDSVIEEYVPGYKESIGEKYNKVKDFIAPKYYYVRDKVKEYIGEDNLEKLNEIKEDASDVVTDLLDSGKEKIKEKYENWRDN